MSFLLSELSMVCRGQSASIEVKHTLTLTSSETTAAGEGYPFVLAVRRGVRGLKLKTILKLMATSWLAGCAAIDSMGSWLSSASLLWDTLR
ncbi:hypothetical protein AXG93_3217s1410 [Marchantia polymorpha subsp. ruderalis]|uniref:Uncharacterized protein n=1 Tax=Marchantia polymorpha subsp. ruderalis TaxID=1480154 RepID=A0A176VWD8_MARPO|nr:hypothetical protein AXG93_3217s1410 [Marchantia polymorpha subsp. ruderalis]